MSAWPLRYSLRAMSLLRTIGAAVEESASTLIHEKLWIQISFHFTSERGVWSCAHLSVTKHLACDPGYIPLKEHTNIRRGNPATDVSPGEENHLFPKQPRTYTFVYLSCGVVHPPPDIKIYERCPTEGGINNFVPDSYPPPLGLLPL
ncbi:hypothetical protein NPIL_396201 [Nephila pilipes]|uniref:Uncharacterized protein n=1 Tax=Nephila pilipes TaxID=299642 RepID=A0A8X6M9A9_NEPPI|nr:hypothetical protein NPIL_396201 [Nephila pilipes]